ncbi:MAG: class III signal peptide-containing protein [Methanobrevibacter sp.]|nr:class III signal peptide-containing protein [Methanobrevibacter sp.]
MKYKKIFNDKKGQGSAEMILLMGAIIAIVLVAGVYLFSISSAINDSIKQVIESGRNSVINKI